MIYLFNVLFNMESIVALSNQLILDKLAQCNCCRKHQINKPKLYAKWIETSQNNGLFPETSNTNPLTNELYCKCDFILDALCICRTCS